MLPKSFPIMILKVDLKRIIEHDWFDIEKRLYE